MSEFTASRLLSVIPPASRRSSSESGIILTPSGVDVPRRRPDGAVGRELVPAFSGAVHYFHHPAERWPSLLDAVESLGLTMIDVYIPWGVHEIAEGQLDFGDVEQHLDVCRFLELAHERRMLAMVRPGPHINAELTYFGLPERVIWDRACQARSPGDGPVALPMVPKAFPVPSYASEKFLDEACRWLERVGKELSGLVCPNGPIALVQIDNEGALYFRDGVYDQDYHPDALRLFCTFLERKYGSEEALASAWQSPGIAFRQATPPRELDSRTPDGWVRHLDWAEFQEEIVVRAMARFARALGEGGLVGAPTLHNVPMGEALTPLAPAKLRDAVDLVAADYYHGVSERDHATIARRTTEIVGLAESHGAFGFAAELGIGYPPFFPPRNDETSFYVWLTALAYGLRGFNLYMAVGRDRWIGAPIDASGTRLASAGDVEAICRALREVHFHKLRRRTDVLLVVPRGLRRLARLLHGFGPITAGFFNAMGAGYGDGCLELATDDEGGESDLLDADAFLQAFEGALRARGVAFGYADGDVLSRLSTQPAAKWIVSAAGAGLSDALVSRLGSFAAEGIPVTVGPRWPERDEGLRPRASKARPESIELMRAFERSLVDSRVSRTIDSLELSTVTATPTEVHVTVHEDLEGRPRMAFVMNPSGEGLVAHVDIPGHHALKPLADKRGSQPIESQHGCFEVEMEPRSVRLFRISD